MGEQLEKSKNDSCGTGHGFCGCKAVLGLLIIVFVWFWTPEWANIAITVLAALIVLGAGGCMCKKKGFAKK